MSSTTSTRPRPAHVALNDDATTHLLAVDRVGAARLVDAGNVFELDRPASRRVDHKPLYSVQILAVAIVEPHHEIERALTVEHLRHDLALHGRLDELVDGQSPQAELFKLVTVNFNAKLRNDHLLFDLQIAHAWNRGNRRLHLLRLAAKHVEIVAVELDRHLRLDAREHVRDQMRQRLLDRRHDARNVGERLADLFDDVFARSFGVFDRSSR